MDMSRTNLIKLDIPMEGPPFTSKQHIQPTLKGKETISILLQNIKIKGKNSVTLK